MIRKRIAGLGVALRASHPTLLTLFSRLLDAFPPLGEVSTPDLDYTLDAITADGAQIRVQKWRNPPNTMPLDLVMPTLQHDITVEAARSLTESPLLHAAALERDGHVLLIPGESQTGKTTHSAALLRYGFRFLGDDLVLLDPNNDAHAVPFPLRIRASSHERLGALDDIAEPIGPPFTVDAQLTQHALPYPRLRVDTESAFPIRALIAPRIQREGPTRLEPLRASRAAFILMGAILNGVHLQEQGFERATALASRIDCFTLFTHDLDDATHAIDALWSTP